MNEKALTFAKLRRSPVLSGLDIQLSTSWEKPTTHWSTYVQAFGIAAVIMNKWGQMRKDIKMESSKSIQVAPQLGCRAEVSIWDRLGVWWFRSGKRVSKAHLQVKHRQLSFPLEQPFGL